MKQNDINETDIELMLQRYARQRMEQQILDEGDALYSHHLRRASLRHYGVTAFVAVLLVVSLWGATPQVSAQATNRATLADRHAAIATTDLIIHNL